MPVSRLLKSMEGRKTQDGPRDVGRLPRQRPVEQEETRHPASP